MRHRNNYHTLFLLTILFLFQYCSKEGDKDIANIIESTEVIKEGTTNKNGIIIFKDRDTNEEVRIEVKDNNDNPIYNVKVGYIDLDGCEFFQIESQTLPVDYCDYLLFEHFSAKLDDKKRIALQFFLQFLPDLPGDIGLGPAGLDPQYQTG